MAGVVDELEFSGRRSNLVVGLAGEVRRGGEEEVGDGGEEGSVRERREVVCELR